MAADDKYTVRLTDDRRDLTRPSRRRDAHLLATRLGPRYVVWNRATRRQSV